jgi:hypothetical protein
VSLDIVKVFLGRPSAENGVLKHIMEIKSARRFSIVPKWPVFVPSEPVPMTINL